MDLKNNDNSNDIKLNNQDQEGALNTAYYIFPWSEFLTILGFTIIFMIEVLQAKSENQACDNSVGRQKKQGNNLRICLRIR